MPEPTARNSRRDFLKASALAGAGLMVAGRVVDAAAPTPVPPSRKTLDILILGGTGYVGPYQVRAAVERGHRVTVFNRGQAQANLPPGVIQLRGDRSIEKLDLASLKGKKWDAAIDNSQTDHRWVTKTAELLKDSVNHYLYVSTTGVYAPYANPGFITESTMPRLTDNEQGETKTYGVIKALSEIENTKVFGKRAINVRPNFIVGPEDPKARFPYWPKRYAEGGEILVPGLPDDHVQFADVRDLTGFMMHLLETGTTGTFNTAGDDTITMQKFQEALAAAVPGSYSRTWVSDVSFLRTNRVGTLIPWVAPRRTEDGVAYGQNYINSDKAVAAGLQYRPMTETIQDTLMWWNKLTDAQRAAYAFGLDRQRERAALEAWKSSRK
jgi:2'-hydroxyisoflavone reductase